MKRASISEAKNRLSALLDEVRHGETITIEDRGRPVARLVPAVVADDADGRLARLERQGLVRRGTPLPRLTRRVPPPRPARDASIVEAVVDERRSGR